MRNAFSRSIEADLGGVIRFATCDESATITSYQSFGQNAVKPNEIIVHATQKPSFSASRHGFPLPLSGVITADIPTLLRHVPIVDTTFNVVYEGELFAVVRSVAWQALPVDTNLQRCVVEALEYAPPTLDALVGVQHGLVPDNSPVRLGRIVINVYLLNGLERPLGQATICDHYSHMCDAS